MAEGIFWTALSCIVALVMAVVYRPDGDCDGSQVEGTAAPDESCRITASKADAQRRGNSKVHHHWLIILVRESLPARLLKGCKTCFIRTLSAIETDGMRTLFTSLGEMFRTAGELLRLFVRGGRWWLIPMIVVLLLSGMLLLLASATPLGPFIYTLF